MIYQQYRQMNYNVIDNQCAAEAVAELYADISPRGICSGRNEPSTVENSLVFQLHNATNHELVLYSDNAGEEYEFQPIEQAVPIAGLTMIYFTFQLGDKEGCLTSADCFGKVEAYAPEPFVAAFAGNNSLVLYPKTTIPFSVYDIAELRLRKLMSNMSAGSCPICRVTMFSPDREEGIVLNPLPIYIRRHPLQIALFEADAAYYPAGFGDRIGFYYQVFGADSCVFSPGDTALETGNAIQDKGGYTATLYRRTQYTLTAVREEEQVLASVELVPMKAFIQSFKARATSPVKDEMREVTFCFTVKNTHHVYLSRIGRIEVKAGEEQKVSRFFDCSVSRFTLSVENEDGLVQETAVLEEAER